MEFNSEDDCDGHLQFFTLKPGEHIFSTNPLFKSVNFHDLSRGVFDHKVLAKKVKSAMGKANLSAKWPKRVYFARRKEDSKIVGVLVYRVLKNISVLLYLCSSVSSNGLHVGSKLLEIFEKESLLSGRTVLNVPESLGSVVDFYRKKGYHQKSEIRSLIDEKSGVLGGEMVKLLPKSETKMDCVL